MADSLRWQDILGHERNIERLRTMLREGRLPHALLFSGVAGVGKKKVARLVAAALLCKKADAPCGDCPSCRAFLAGTHPDYIEAAPESRGKGARVLRIEAVREIEKKAARKPLLSGRLVVLMDEADAMNEAAANSLLKTLEEPQGEVFFLLVTEKRAALLPTILSRVRDLHFGALPPAVIERHLLAQGVEGGQAKMLAAAADGSLSHALLLLEEDGLQLVEDAAQTLFSGRKRRSWADCRVSAARTGCSPCRDSCATCSCSMRGAVRSIMRKGASAWRVRCRTFPRSASSPCSPRCARRCGA